MSDANNKNQHYSINNLKNNPIVTFTCAIKVLPSGKFLNALRAGLAS
jgi:hypothetical protein